jgi:hypothetical protein
MLFDEELRRLRPELRRRLIAPPLDLRRARGAAGCTTTMSVPDLLRVVRTAACRRRLAMAAQGTAETRRAARLIATELR